MLTGATSKADQNEAFGRMANGPSGKEKEIKVSRFFNGIVGNYKALMMIRDTPVVLCYST